MTQKLSKNNDHVVNPSQVQTLGSITFVEVSYSVQPTIFDCPMATISSPETADYAREIVNRGYFIQGILLELVEWSRTKEPDETRRRIRTLFAKYETVLSGCRSDSHAETVHSSSIEISSESIFYGCTLGKSSFCDFSLNFIFFRGDVWRKIWSIVSFQCNYSVENFKYKLRMHIVWKD